MTINDEARLKQVVMSVPYSTGINKKVSFRYCNKDKGQDISFGIYMEIF